MEKYGKAVILQRPHDFDDVEHLKDSPMAVRIIEGGSGREYDPQQRSDKSAQRNVFGELRKDRIVVPRFVYMKLGNLTDNRHITVAENEDLENEYKLFMMEMERLYYYYQKNRITIPTDRDLEAIPQDLRNVALINMYLGELGVIDEHPFRDDFFSIPVWFTGFLDSEDRNVIDIQPGKDGTDKSETVYNVIAIVNGVDCNVIHERGE